MKDLRLGRKPWHGAVDILVEALSEDVTLRAMTYQEVLRHSKLTSQVKDESLDEKQVFQIYYDFLRQLELCRVIVHWLSIAVRN